LLSWPARQIAINSGEDGSIVVGKILEKDTYTYTYAYGYDAQAGEYGNLISKGIIDPTKVVRAALQGAASIAGLLITTEAMVAEVPKKQSPAMPGGPGGGRTVVEASSAKAAAEALQQLRLFSHVFERVRSDYVEKPDDAKLLEAAIKGMLAGLDPHSTWTRGATATRKWTHLENLVG
jgi:hypothetical protein